MIIKILSKLEYNTDYISILAKYKVELNAKP